MSDNKRQFKHSKIQHDLEHRQWSRRSFIQALGIGGSGSLVLGGSMLRASAVSPLAVALNRADSDRILVLIRLQGGNDGLNTIVPMQYYDTYANYRPNIYHRQNELISLNDDFSIPRYMSPLESMWGDGKMKVVHGVGYEDQSLSHFTSSDIWATTQRTQQFEDGFLGRHFTERYPDYLLNPPVEPLAIQIGSVGNLIFNDEDISYSFLVSNPDELQQIAENGTQFDMADIDKTCHLGIQKEFLRQQANATYAYSGVIHEAYSNASNSVDYADNQLSKQLAIVARLIKGNLGTKVFMVTLNGFDTHSDQITRHENLMNDLSNGVKNFFDDLNQTGHDQNVLGMTFSEFGRRAMENGSNGTDHGAASTTMFFGPGLGGNGFAGEHPDMNDLDRNGNLNYSTDFRGLYATVLSQWLCLDIGQVANALEGNYDSLNLGFDCVAEPGNPAEPEDPAEPENPTEPESPTDPAEPSDPENPTDPANPAEPSDPENPSDPADPGDPAEPSDPENPSNPVDPANPSEPENPTDPADPAEPSDPENPSDPVDPANPSEPENPTDPADPAEPSDPENPTDPVDPAEPSGPADPANPSEPENPNNPANPTDPEPPTEGADTTEPLEEEAAFEHTPIYGGAKMPVIILNVPRTMHVDLQLYDISGKRLGTVTNGFMTKGTHTIRLDETMQDTTIVQGQYIYRVTTNEGSFSKLILVQ